MNRKHQIVIVGAGTAGISSAATLMANYPDMSWDIVIIDPSDKHYYQPLWTLVGAGVYPKEESERNQADYIPHGTQWVKDSVLEFRPKENKVVLAGGDEIEYEYLIVAAGIQLDWHKIKGLEETLGKNGVTSNYRFDLCEQTWKNIQALKAGRALFTQPPMPIKCAGAPQKIVYMAEDYFRKNNLRSNIDITFCLAGPRIFGVEKYREALEKVLLRKEIAPHYEHNLVEIDGPRKVATFETPSGQRVEFEFEMAHVVPPMSAPDFIKKSELADSAGWVEVDKFTTQHMRFANVFSIGDCSSLPTSRTGAAIRKQVPALTENLVAAIKGAPLKAKYDGYASCPLVTGYGSAILAEFDYDGKPSESFPFDQARERFSMYMLKTHGLPKLYWHGMLKGKA